MSVKASDIITPNADSIVSDAVSIPKTFRFRIFLRNINGDPQELILAGSANLSENSAGNDPNTIYLNGEAQIAAPDTEDDLIGVYSAEIHLIPVVANADFAAGMGNRFTNCTRALMDSIQGRQMEAIDPNRNRNINATNNNNTNNNIRVPRFLPFRWA